MMPFETTEKTILRMAGLFLTVFLLALPSAGAEDQAKEKHMIGPQRDIQKDMPREQGLQSSESMTRELSAPTEKPMMTPESDGSLHMDQLITPSITDFETARESDRQSAVSF